MNRRALSVLTLLLLAGAAEAANWRAKMLQDLAKTATSFDAVLQSPSSDPTPAWGSAIKVTTDDKGIKHNDVTISACTSDLHYKDVPASGDFSKVVQTELQVGVGVAYEVVDVSGGFSNKQVGGLEYHLTGKRILDPDSVDAYRRCCLIKPDQCQDQVITEWWKGLGAYYYLANSKADAKVAVKNVQFAPQANVSWSRGWGVSMKWPSEGSGQAAFPDAGWQDSGQYFAYRAQPISVPTCQQYMIESPEKPGFTLFSGVSDWYDSESLARNKAREDVLKQVAAYCGTDVVGNFDAAGIQFGDRVFATVDGFACQDKEDAGGVVKYLGRNRVWMSDENLQLCLQRKGMTPPPPAQPTPTTPRPKKPKN
jgi:hypothetical protein